MTYLEYSIATSPSLIRSTFEKLSMDKIRSVLTASLTETNRFEAVEDDPEKRRLEECPLER